LEQLEERQLLAVDLASGVSDPTLMGATANGESKSTSWAVSSDGRYAVFQSVACNLVVGDTNRMTDVFRWDLLTGAATLVSTDAAGNQGDAGSYTLTISADGRYVAFESAATNLVHSDTNGVRDVFVKDLQSGAITRASTASTGGEANGISSCAAISGDGRYVAFKSAATNLVANDTNAADDLFVKDLQTGVIVCASTTAAGVQGDDDCYSLAISGNGRYVAFESFATNLVADDANATSDVFVKDLQTGALVHASTSSAGVQANGGAFPPAISADGRYVTFACYATNLVDDDTNNVVDVFVKDCVSGATIRVSTNSSGVQGNGNSFSPSISGDGRYVAFCSIATNLVSGDTNADCDVFVKDLVSGVTTRASASGVQTNDDSEIPAISADGRYVTFVSEATNLVSGDNNLQRDVFVWDRQATTVALVSARATDWSGTVTANAGSSTPAVSGDGRYVVFASDATNLVSGDTNGVKDVFLTDLASDVTTRVSTKPSGAQGSHASSCPTISSDGRYVAFIGDSDLVGIPLGWSQRVLVKDLQTGVTTRVDTTAVGTQGNLSAFDCAISGDGGYVAFSTYATNLVDDDTNAAVDVFVKNLHTGVLTCVSTDSNATLGNSYSCDAVVSNGGRYVAFCSEAANLVDGDTNGRIDVFVKDLETGVTTRISANSAGVQGDSHSHSPAISADGRYVAFYSEATNLVDGDTNGVPDVFVYDCQTGITSRVSTDSSGTQGNDISQSPSVCSDGRYVAFCSEATNLDSGNINTSGDRLFVKDLTTGVTARVCADANVSDPAICGDGGSVAFVSLSSDLVDGDGNARGDVFRAHNPLVDNAPTAIEVSNAAVDEQSPAGTLVGLLSTTDADAGDTFTYTLVDSAGGRFRIDGAQLLVDDGSLLDYETAASHAVTVRTTDAGGLSCEQEFTITVRNVNETPNAITLSAAAVYEQSAAGALVGVLSTTDADAGDTFTYTLVDSAGGRFKIDGAQLLVDDALLDHETAASQTIIVRTTDAGGLSYEQEFTIIVRNVNETPIAIALSAAEVDEESDTGTLVGLLSTTDADAGDTFTYTLVDSAGGRFKISGAQLLVDDGSRLDYETAASHTVTVRTTDAGGLSYERQFIITVNDIAETRVIDAVAVYDPTTSMFFLRNGNSSGPADATFGYGVSNAGWQTLVGDWDGDGSTGVGLFDGSTSTFYLTNAHVSGSAEFTFGYGVPNAGWIPLVGDWDGDGAAGVGLYDPTTSTFFLTDTLAAGVAEYTFCYGVANDGWTPLVGDWDGTGGSGVGLYDPHLSGFYLTDTLATGYACYTFGYGVPDEGWTPLVGDWNGDGAAGVGLYDPSGSTFYLTDTLAAGCAEHTFGYGVPGAGWTPLVGDWNGDGAAGVGLYDATGTTFYLSNNFATGVADSVVQIAEATPGCVPLVGHWTGAEPLSAAGVDAVDVAQLAALQLAGLGSSPLA
jgi:Tol biopolymer transport system component